MFKALCIADIHYGASDPITLSEELNTFFISYIKKIRSSLKLVVICGDLFDRKISLNSSASKQCMAFIGEVARLCEIYKVAFRIVKGTKNHDLDQLNNFLYLQERKKLDFKIITKVTEEEIEGKKILYIPEEYIQDKKEYYKDYLYANKKYDICFLHGTFKHIQFTNNLESSERPIADAPLFTYKEFEPLDCKVLCGHIHEHQQYKKTIYYAGSFSRWVFGEEAPKGFLLYKEDEGKVSVRFIENKDAPIYKTVKASDIIDINSQDIDKEIKKIDQYKKKNHISHLRINIDNEEKDIVNSDVIRNYFNSNNNQVKIVKSETITQEDEEDQEIEEKYSFIFNDENGDDIHGIAKNVSKYLEVHSNILISPNEVEEILIED